MVIFLNINSVYSIIQLMKKLLLILIFLINLILPSFAIVDTEDKVKISLEEAMDLALNGNIELQEQRKNLGISQNDIKRANALKNPQVQSNLLVGRISKANSSQVGVMLPVEIAKRSARKSAAESGLNYTENKIKDYEFKLKQRVRTAYFNLILAKSQLKIMEDRKILLEDLLEISKNHSKDSPNYEIELLQADMRLKKQLVQINKSKADVKTAQYTFNKVLNLENNMNLYDVKEESVFSEAFFTNLELPAYEDLIEYAFSHRYDIKMAQARLDKTKKDITIALRKRVPDLYISGGYAFAHDGTPGAFVGAGLDIPSLYTYTPEIQNAKLEYEKAQLGYNSITNITKNIISTNYDKFIMAQENVGYYNSMIDESKRILDLSKQRYQKGQTTITNLIIIEHSHQDLLKEFLNSMGVYYNAYISLLTELGMENFSIDVDL